MAVKNRGRLMRAVMPGRTQSASRSPIVAIPNGSSAPSPDWGGSGRVRKGKEEVVARRLIVRTVSSPHGSGNQLFESLWHAHDALPRASFIGFAGTPIELKDANKRAVFGFFQRMMYVSLLKGLVRDGLLLKVGSLTTDVWSS